MGNFTADITTIVIRFAVILLIIWVIVGTTVMGVSFRQTSVYASAIDDINTTIASYIQKNGQYYDNDPAARARFEEALISVHGMDLAGTANCNYCVDIEVTPRVGTTFNNGEEVQRSTIYDIRTNYNYHNINFSLFSLEGRWRPAKQRSAVAYVHQYVNDGHMNR